MSGELQGTNTHSDAKVECAYVGVWVCEWGIAGNTHSDAKVECAYVCVSAKLQDQEMYNKLIR